jgi:hypothetical protein
MDANTTTAGVIRFRVARHRDEPFRLALVELARRGQGLRAVRADSSAAPVSG